MTATFDNLMWIVLSVSLAALIYSQVIYPLLFALISLRKRPSAPCSNWPSVSLIIPAYNESLVIEQKIKNSLAIDYPADKLEILVASDGSDDGTIDKAQAFADRGIRVLDLQPRRGKASVLNDAVEAAQGEVLCLCDANVMFHPDALRNMVAYFSDQTIGAVTGDVRLQSKDTDFGTGESLYYKLERAIQRGESQVGSLICVDGGMYVLKRECFSPLPHDTILDDFATTMNVIHSGHRVVYADKAVAEEDSAPDWQQEFRRRVRTTRGAIHSVRRRIWPPLTRPFVWGQYASHKLLRWLGPFWLLGLAISSIWLWTAGRSVQAVVLFQVTVYGLAVLGWLFNRLRVTRICGIPFYFVMSHFAMAVGVFQGLFRPATGVWSRTERLTFSKASNGQASSKHDQISYSANTRNRIHQTDC